MCVYTVYIYQNICFTSHRALRVGRCHDYRLRLSHHSNWLSCSHHRLCIGCGHHWLWLGSHEGCLLRVTTTQHWSIVAAGMRSWIRGDIAPRIFRVHVFVHLGERAREAAKHHAAVATTVLVRDVVSGAHPRAEVGNKHNVQDQECCADNPGKAVDPGGQIRYPRKHTHDETVARWDSKKKEKHQPALHAVTSGRLWGAVNSQKTRSVRSTRRNLPDETRNACQHHNELGKRNKK